MTKKVDLRLCGGTFFTLFLESRKPLLTANDYYSGDAEPLAGPIALFALAQVMVSDWPSFFGHGNNKRTITGNTSEYKLCKEEGGSIFPFGDNDSKAAFTRHIKEYYYEPLNQMYKAVSAFVDTGSRRRHDTLVKRLLTLIERDSSITPETLFYVLRNGQPITKAKLLEMTEYDLQPFLLGVWHFAVTRKEGNKVGAETIQILCPSTGGGQRDYNGALDSFFSRSISVECSNPAPCTANSTERDDEYAAETMEAEIVEPQDNPDEKEKAADSGSQQTVNNINPTFFNFNINGGSNSFYENNGTMIVKK